MQHLKYILFVAIAILTASCDKYDIQGFFIAPSKERVNKRFEQSIEYNQHHLNDTLIISNQEDYTFLAAADFHVKTTAVNLAKYTKITASNPNVLFSTILGDITDQLGGLQIAYDSIKNNKGDATMRILAGNHDTYFDQWSEYYKLFGSSTYFFVVKTPTTSDLFITLETASGTLGKLQKKWLDDILSEKRSQHRYCFVLTHTNFFDTELSQFPSGNFPIEETAFLTNIFDRYNVNLIISGHDHSYDYTELNGVSYLTLEDAQDLDKKPSYFAINVQANEITFEKEAL
jgi:3',5'-cyclic AMP phosphodiesterase CpdA